MDANTTLANAIAAGFDRLSPRDVMLCVLYGANGGASGGATTFGNYAGGQPNFTPASGFGLAVDTSNGALWEYYGGSWH